MTRISGGSRGRPGAGAVPGPTSGPPGRSGAAVPLLVLALALPHLAGCGGAPEEGGATTISRTRFVETYVDLRLAALRADGGDLDEATRDSILSAHGVTGEELLRFAEVRGRRPEEMTAVWDTVELRLLRAAEDTGGDDGG